MAALPEDIEAQILPSFKLSILELLQYNLPIQHPNFQPSQISDFFDKNGPNQTDPNIISRIPTPSKEVILSLQKHLVKATKNSDMSIKCIHSIAAEGMTYPLWIIAYWVKVGSVRDIRDSWRKAEVYLRGCLQRWRKKKNTEGVNVVNQIFDALAIVRWSDKLCGFTANAAESLDNITYYASSKWLTGDMPTKCLIFFVKVFNEDSSPTSKFLPPIFSQRLARASMTKTSIQTTTAFIFTAALEMTSQPEFQTRWLFSST
jgi:hypothetical protein